MANVVNQERTESKDKTVRQEELELMDNQAHKEKEELLVSWLNRFWILLIFQSILI